MKASTTLSSKEPVSFPKLKCGSDLVLCCSVTSSIPMLKSFTSSPWIESPSSFTGVHSPVADTSTLVGSATQQQRHKQNPPKNTNTQQEKKKSVFGTCCRDGPSSCSSRSDPGVLLDHREAAKIVTSQKNFLGNCK